MAYTRVPINAIGYQYLPVPPYSYARISKRITFTGTQSSFCVRDLSLKAALNKKNNKYAEMSLQICLSVTPMIGSIVIDMQTNLLQIFFYLQFTEFLNSTPHPLVVLFLAITCECFWKDKSEVSWEAYKGFSLVIYHKNCTNDFEMNVCKKTTLIYGEHKTMLEAVEDNVGWCVLYMSFNFLHRRHFNFLCY